MPGYCVATSSHKSGKWPLLYKALYICSFTKKELSKCPGTEVSRNRSVQEQKCPGAKAYEGQERSLM
ncbi:hypothetical protein DPEC_G00036940 [Dallia pectoralis]|uniref:Uncharacterized protein n=1 Tax=Dallia pectoralis TaxID=75939 RepID=A0ACC2HDS7_DALPE|nr:hypothetical protein DPEC_G00036940 [Dallia pectoralis]